MNRTRQRWISRLIEAVIALAPNRMDAEERRKRLSRFSFETNVTRWPLRMTERLRDRLRSAWLTLKR